MQPIDPGYAECKRPAALPAMYSPRLLDHFENPRNPGKLDPPAVSVRVENPICGDILELSALWEGGCIAEARFQAKGCTASIATGSALTELLLGKSPAELERLDKAGIEEAVGGLSNESKHAAVLALDGVKALARAAKSAS
ncbi:MAG: iron-sulfur cluster assembly scaffold protein [Acidobacteria bacterium]|nr:iron-sulfur cluster assembly scaffold protein [Acidobacteriota bacterium]